MDAESEQNQGAEALQLNQRALAAQRAGRTGFTSKLTTKVESIGFSESRRNRPQFFLDAIYPETAFHLPAQCKRDII